MTNDEKDRRIYYQDIVYSVCTVIDSLFAGTVVCGTADEPSQQVQKRMYQIQRALTHARHALRQVDEHGGPYPQYPELDIALGELRKCMEDDSE